MQSSELPQDERDERDQEVGSEASRPRAGHEPALASANVGDEFAGSVDLPAGVGDPSVSVAAEPTIDVSSVPVSPTEPFASSLEMNANADLKSSAPDEEVSPTPDADLTADTNGEEQSADGPSPVESADSTGNVSASIATDSAADSVLFDDGPGSGADFADLAEGSYASDARTVTESVADPWLNSMMATHSRGSSFYSPPDDLAGGDDAAAPDSTEEAPPTSKPFIGPLLGSDGEDPAEQWMRYYQAVHDAARNPRIYSASEGPNFSEDSLALPLALPVTLRHMTPLVEKLIGRAAIEIHQVCEELAKQQIDQFKYELYTEMRALG